MPIRPHPANNQRAGVAKSIEHWCLRTSRFLWQRHACSPGSREYCTAFVHVVLMAKLANMSAQLSQTGYYVQNNAASEEMCAVLRQEIEHLNKAGQLQPASIRLRTAGPSLGLPVTSSRAVRRGEDCAGVECSKAGVNELSVVLGGDIVEPQALALCPTLSLLLGKQAVASPPGPIRLQNLS